MNGRVFSVLFDFKLVLFAAKLSKLNEALFLEFKLEVLFDQAIYKSQSQMQRCHVLLITS